MNGALWFLVRRSFVNRLRFQLARLREPRYLVPMLAALAYLGFFVFMPMFAASPNQALGGTFGSAARPMFLAGVFLMAILSWVSAALNPAPTFTESDVCMLFPAPLTRRQLVRYWLLKAQPQLLFLAAILTVFTGYHRGFPGALFYGVGLFVFLNTYLVFRCFATICVAKLIAVVGDGLIRWLPAVLVGSAIIGVFGYSAGPLKIEPGPEAIEQALQWFERGATTGPAEYLFYPLRTIAGMPMAADPATFGLSLLFTLGLLSLLVVLVGWIDAPFEETAIAGAGKLARRIERVRRGRGLHADLSKKSRVRKPPFALAPRGPVWRAIAWKNAVATWRQSKLPLVFGLGPVAVYAAVRVVGFDEIKAQLTFAALAGMALTMSVMFGPSVIRNDLRADLEYPEFLKTAPVGGRSYLRGSIVSAPLFIWVSQLVVLACAVVILTGPAEETIAAPDRLIVAGATALVLPGLTLGAFTIDNLMAALMPAWIVPPRGQEMSPGIEQMGREMVIMGSRLMGLMGLSFVPAVIGIPLGIVLAPLLGLWVLIPIAALVLAMLLAEIELLLILGGRWLESIEPTI